MALDNAMPHFVRDGRQPRRRHPLFSFSLVTFAMPFVLFVIGLPLGSVLGAFLVVQPLIIAFFGIPFTRALNKDDLLHGAPVLRKMIISLMLLVSVGAAVVVALEMWAPIGLRRGVFVGGIWATLKALNRVGMNTANLADYVAAHGQHLDASTRAEMDAMIAADAPMRDAFSPRT